MRKYWPILALFLIFLASCSPVTVFPEATQISVSTPLPASETPTETVTFTPTSPSLNPTPVYIEATLTIKVNVRSGPGTTYDSLGQLEAGTKVQILNKDKSGSWYQILYEPSTEGQGWVAAAYVQVPAGTEVPLDATPTPRGPTGVVSQRLNIRSGPGTTFDSLGTLEPKSVVSLTGKNSTASWFQIDYASGPGGRGWVTAQYIQTEAAGGLPILDEYGTPAAATAAGTPAGPAAIPTATLGPALADGDSQPAPGVVVTFSAGGTRRFTYSSQVSAPEGDEEDWVQFTPYATGGKQAQLLFSLSCIGNGSLTVELWQSGASVLAWGSLACGDIGKVVSLAAGEPYELRLAAVSGGGLRLVDYTLSVENRP